MTSVRKLQCTTCTLLCAMQQKPWSTQFEYKPISFLFFLKPICCMHSFYILKMYKSFDLTLLYLAYFFAQSYF